MALDQAGIGWRVRIYVSEADTWQHQPTYQAVLQLLRRERCAGATVVRGIMGFTHGRITTANLVDLAPALPIVVEWIDRPERVQRLLPALTEMAPDGLITVEEVRVVKYPRSALQDVPRDLRVRDVMTPAERVVAAPVDASLHEMVVLLLRKGRHAVPVLDRDRRVVGIITNRDLVERAGLPLRLELLRALGDPEQPAVAAHLAGLRGEGRTAASIMTREVVTIGPDAMVADAARVMLERRLKRLPVVDDAGHLLGMLSRIDVLKTVSTGFQRWEPVLEPAEQRLGNHPAPSQVGAVMNPHVPLVRPTTPLAEVLDAVVSTRLNRAVVVDDARRPVGIVVDTDLMRLVTPHAHPGLMQRLMHRVLPGSAESRQEWQRLTGQCAADVMRPREQMLVVPVDAPIAEVIDQSLARRSKLITVVDGAGQVVGMADRADLLAALTTTV